MKMISNSVAIGSVLAARDKYVIPDWQRDEVWDTPRRQGLIDSILRGYRLPKFYLALDKSGNFEVVDGQQRLSAIKAFVAGEYELSSLTREELAISAVKFQDLMPNISKRYSILPSKLMNLLRPRKRKSANFSCAFSKACPLQHQRSLMP